MALFEGETTQWQDIHERLGNFEARPKEITREELERAAVEVAEEFDPLENRTLGELDQLEDDVEDDVLRKYREKRMAEMKEKMARHKFGEVRDLSKKDFVKEVNEAGTGVQVVVLLYQDHIEECQLLLRALRDLAPRHGAVKFLKGISNDIVDGYPDSRLPALLLYKDGDCQEQIIGGHHYGGKHMSNDCVEWLLAKKEVIETEIEDDPLEEIPTSLRGRFTMDADFDGDRCFSSTKLDNIWKRSP